jgi:iron complex outermembrane receptor protein
MVALLAAAAAAASPDDDAVIVVVGERRGEETISVLATIDAAAAASRDVKDLGDILRQAPGVVVRTNSRGETLPFFPASGERETAVFLGAAPLNVAWDNRVDLAAIPAAVVDVRLTRGAGAAAGGARSSAGRVNVDPALSDADDGEFLGRAEAATGAAVAFDAAARFGTAGGGGLLAIGFLDEDGARLADPARTPFSQRSARRRTNDDLRRLSVLAHAAVRRDEVEFEATALFADAEQGAPPESDRDPATAAVRYWRYPLERLLLLGAESEFRLSPATSVGASAYGQIFRQQIDSFTADDYATLEGSQEDRNAAVGGRLFATRSLSSAASLTVDVSISRADHRERTYRAGVPPGGFEFFREIATSGGAALNVAVPGAGRAILRAGVDRLATPATAGRPRQENFTAPFAGVEAAFPFGGLRLGGQLAYKSRPPTLRELYGAALGRFLPNPGLKAETALYGELVGAYRGEAFEASLIGFIRDVDDTLEQRSVVVAGRTLRQRINLAGSRSVGAVASARWSPAQWLAFSGDATLVRERPKGSGPIARLTERPGHIARVRAEIEKGRFSAYGEVERFGAVYSLDGAGALVRLDPGTFVNFRAALAVREGVEFYARIDNAGDAFYEPQAGLPADGRRIGAGVTVGY